MMKQRGFTLVELSIVLVIIGLIIGGVLVGRDLIAAATIRAQITQIEKFQSAVNTFRGKYGFLPGDMPDPYASNYGFIGGGAGCPGRGDGNGIVEGDENPGCGTGSGFAEFEGETIAFWAHLSAANLINGAFTQASQTASPAINPVTLTSTPSINDYFPKAAIGSGNYVYVWSGGTAQALGGSADDEKNYFGIETILQYTNAALVLPQSGGRDLPGVTVQQAYNIDSKIDDGLPTSGRVTAMYVKNQPWWEWQAPTLPINEFTGTCYDNGGIAGPDNYSISMNAAATNCALSFQFQ